MKNLKNTLTNIVAGVIVVVTALQTALEANAGNDINWFSVVAAVAIAAIGYLTGKTGDGKGIV